MFSSTLLAAFLFFLSALSVSAGGECSTLLERREWRSLHHSEKAEYINAVKCLQSRPAISPSISAAKSRFDEFQALHITVALDIHYVGQFLPWHRQFVYLFEKALRTECGYKGAQPYWDWSLDTDNGAFFRNSPIFDSTTGFGGDGVPGTYTVPSDPSGVSRLFPERFTGCVRDGPFADYKLSLGPGLFVTEHCLTRGISELLSNFFTSSAVANVTAMKTFEEFRVGVEGVPGTNPRMHGAGHINVGGEMTNFFSSAGDPLFYLHHSNLDRIWSAWQQQDPARYFDISGPTTINPPFTNVTLAFPMNMGTLGSIEPISTVMNIRSEHLCYTYA